MWVFDLHAFMEFVVWCDRGKFYLVVHIEDFELVPCFAMT